MGGELKLACDFYCEFTESSADFAIDFWFDVQLQTGPGSVASTGRRDYMVFAQKSLVWVICVDGGPPERREPFESPCGFLVENSQSSVEVLVGLS